MSGDKKIVAGLSIDTGDGKQQLENLRNAVVAFGDSGAAAANEIVTPFENIYDIADRVNKKIHDGRTVTVRDGDAMVQQFSLLQAAIARAFGTLENAPAQVQQAFQSVGRVADQTTTTVKSLTTASEANRQALVGNTFQWNGWINQIIKVNPALAEAGLSLAGVATAFTVGLKAGTAFAEGIGTDFTAAQSAAAALKGSVAGVTDALFTDGLLGAAEQATLAIKTLGDSVLGTGRAHEAFNILLEAGIDRARQAELTDDQLIAVVNAHAAAVKGGSVALQFFNDTLRLNKDNLDGAIKQLVDAIPKLDQYAKKLDEQKKAVQAQTDELKHQREEEQRLIDKHDDEIRKIDTLVSSLSTEEGARTRVHDAVTKLLTALANLDQAQGGTTQSIAATAAALADQLDKFDQNIPAINISISQLQSLKNTTTGLSDETRRQIDGMVSAKQTIEGLTQKNKELADQEKALTSSGAADTAQGFEQIQAIDGQISANDGLIAAAKDKLASDAKQLSSTDAITKAQNDAAEAAGKAADKTIQVGSAADGTTGKVNGLVFKVEDLKTKVQGPDGINTAIANLQQMFKNTDVAIDAHIQKIAQLETAITRLSTSYGIAQQAAKNLAKIISGKDIPQASVAPPAPAGPGPQIGVPTP